MKKTEPPTALTLRLLGTGAADWDWRPRPLPPETRGSCSTLLNGHILIDAGATAEENLRRGGIDPAAITDVLITHSHRDHFSVRALHAFAEAKGRRGKLRVWASPEALARLDATVTKKPLTAGRCFQLGELAVTTLPANHVVDDLREETFHFLIETPAGKRLLYALDGAWMTSRAKAMLAGKPLDLIVWDATCGTTLNDWRFADHNDLRMIRDLRESMAKAGIVTGETRHVFDHIARTLWPESAAKRRAAAKEYGGLLAADGMELVL